MSYTVTAECPYCVCQTLPRFLQTFPSYVHFYSCACVIEKSLFCLVCRPHIVVGYNCDSFHDVCPTATCCTNGSCMWHLVTYTMSLSPLKSLLCPCCSGFDSTEKKLHIEWVITVLILLSKQQWHSLKRTGDTGTSSTAHAYYLIPPVCPPNAPKEVFSDTVAVPALLAQ